MIDTERLIASVSEAIRKEVARHEQQDERYCVRIGYSPVGDFAGHDARAQAFWAAAKLVPVEEITVCRYENGGWRIIGRINA